MSTDDQETPTSDEQPAPAPQPGERIVLFWIAAWLGTVAAGSTFGGLIVGFALLAVGPGGGEVVPFFFVALFVGAVWAGMHAIPIHVTIAILTWAFWLNRFRLATAAIAGAATGIAATIFLEPWLAALAGPLGAIGGAAAGYLHIKRQANKRPTSDASEKTVWQFTIRDLLVRMTVLAMLVSAWTYFFKAVRKDRERERQYQEAYEAAQQSAEDPLRDETQPDATPLEASPPPDFET